MRSSKCLYSLEWTIFHAYDWTWSKAELFWLLLLYCVFLRIKDRICNLFTKSSFQTLFSLFFFLSTVPLSLHNNPATGDFAAQRLELPVRYTFEVMCHANKYSKSNVCRHRDCRSQVYFPFYLTPQAVQGLYVLRNLKMRLGEGKLACYHYCI